MKSKWDRRFHNIICGEFSLLNSASLTPILFNGGTIKIFYHGTPPNITNNPPDGSNPTGGVAYTPRLYFRNLDELPLIEPVCWFLY